MELLVAIDALDDLVYGSRRVPLTAQVRIDEQTLQDAVHRLRAEVTELFGASPGSMGSIAEVVGAIGDLEEVVRAARRIPLTTQVRVDQEEIFTLLDRMRAALGSALLGELRPGELTGAGWGWLVCVAVVSTVAAVTLFFAGLKRVGPTTASILATVEPLVTVLLAFLVFGEMLSAVQLAGGALVVGGVLVLHVRLPRSRRAGTPATSPACVNQT